MISVDKARDVEVRAAAGTHVGYRRRRNEDYHSMGDCRLTRTDGEVIATAERARPFLIVLADGLGGHPAGDVASRVAVEFIVAEQPRNGAALVDAVRNANLRVFRAMNEPGGEPTMGTTIAAILVHGTAVTAVNVGDSLIFEATSCTLTEVGVSDSDTAGYLTQTLGGSDQFHQIEPHVVTFTVESPQRFVLSTDGLTNFVTTDLIADALTRRDPAAAVNRLLSLALTAGAPDNVTAAVVDVRPSTVSGCGHPGVVLRSRERGSGS